MVLFQYSLRAMLNYFNVKVLFKKEAKMENSAKTFKFCYWF